MQSDSESREVEIDSLFCHFVLGRKEGGGRICLSLEFSNTYLYQQISYLDEFQCHESSVRLRIVDEIEMGTILVQTLECRHHDVDRAELKTLH